MSEKLAKGGNHRFHGAPPISELSNKRRIEMKEQIIADVMEVRSMKLADARKKLKEKNLPLGKRAIIDAYIKRKHNDIKIYEDRAVGKARESVEINADVMSRVHYEPVKNDKDK